MVQVVTMVQVVRVVQVSPEQPKPRYTAYHRYRMFFKISKNIAITFYSLDILRYFLSLFLLVITKSNCGATFPLQFQCKTGGP